MMPLRAFLTTRSKTVRIAQIAPIIERVPPKKYGGTERVVHILAEELVKRGHQVTLFASGDSLTSAKLVSVYPRALREAKIKDLYGLNTWTMLNVGMAYSLQNQFDIIHDHTGHLSLPAANLSQTPVVMTLHGPFTTDNKRIYETLNNPYFVGISKDQTKSAPNLKHLSCVYNGLKMEHYPFSAEHEGYLLFVGRISSEKGVHNAIDAAQYLNLPLIIAAKLESVDLAYFNEYIGPRLSETIKWIGEVDEEERNKLMSKALCFLHPITWREPFGLTMIEAMACGCPVVGFNRGSIPEIVKNGVSGFVVNDTDEMIEAISNIGQINRQECRNYALKNFNAECMTSGYEAVYQTVLKKIKPHNGEAGKFYTNPLIKPFL